MDPLEFNTTKYIHALQRCFLADMGDAVPYGVPWYWYIQYTTATRHKGIDNRERNIL